MTTWVEKLDQASIAKRSLVCVGLDPDPRRMPVPEVFEFNRAIIDATHDLVCAYKPQLAFYEALGIDGLKALGQTLEHIRRAAPGVVVIGDAKRGDIESTAEAYAKAMFEYWGFDVVTVHAYLGRESVEPFLTREGRGALIVCRTSNPGALELQDLRLATGPTGGPLPKPASPEQSRREESVRRSQGHTAPGASTSSARDAGNGLRLFEHVAALAEEWNTRGNVGLVVGATYPEELAALRAAHPALPILIPGIGAQSGNVEKSTRAGINSDGRGIVISASRSIIYASDDRRNFAEAARSAVESLRSQVAAASSPGPSKDRR
ncbi:MAG: orotidine-5'-phosphate decarboxylase [Chloroflexi bacterium]|nr:orotidine-5'-phosphate decarboxylase [Chloroflexota bacterium]